MKTKHTKVEWKIDGQNIECNDRFIARVFVPSKTEAEANAKLIASAPDLLEACECALDYMEYNNITGQARLLLTLAIKKATE